MTRALLAALLLCLLHAGSAQARYLCLHLHRAPEHARHAGRAL